MGYRGSGDPILDMTVMLMGAQYRKRNPVYRFYRTTDPFGFLSNFYRAKVQYQGKEYPTSEHLYQAMKFFDTDPEWAEEIRQTPRPGDAAKKGRDRSHPIREDWEKVKLNAMRLTVLLKFAQNTDIQHGLLDTGTAKLVEHTSRDSIWGDGGDGSGLNLLGQVLMEVRHALRENAEHGEPSIESMVERLEKKLEYMKPEEPSE